jgi:hypothetical protein
MRNYVLSYLASKGTAVEAFVSTGARSIAVTRSHAAADLTRLSQL